MQPREPVRVEDPLLLAACGLGLGVALAGGAWAGAAIGAALLAGHLARAERRRRAGALLLAFLALGIGRGRAALDDCTPLAPGTLLDVEGTLASSLAGADPGEDARLVLEHPLVRGGGRSIALDGDVAVHVSGLPPDLTCGTRIALRARTLPERSARNPGGGDPACARRRAGVALALACDHPATLRVVADPAPLDPRAALDRARRALLDRIRAGLDPPAAALSGALLLGTRGGLDGELLRAAQESGTIHILAISGAQIALLVGALRALLGLLLPGARADALAVALALLYAGIAGADAPVLRAAVSAALFLPARARGRDPKPSEPLAAAALAVLLIEPSELFRPGFQLSFAAVAALITHRAPPRPLARSRLRRIAAGLRGALALSWRATRFTAPLVWFHFGLLSPLAPMLTLLLTPPFLVAFFACAAQAFVLPAGPVAAVAEASCHLLESGFRAGARLPLASIHVPRLSLPAAALLLCGCIRERGAARHAFVAAGLLVQAVRFLPPEATTLDVLDVGHGQAVLLRGRDGATALFDCGSRAIDSPARRIVLPALDALAVFRLDLLVLSHSDADHLNGAAELIESGRVARVAAFPGALAHPATRALRAAARAEGVPVAELARGDAVALGECRLRVLGPASSAADASDNDASLVLLVETPGGGVLLPGDVEGAGLRELLRATPDLSASVLLLPHHGLDEPWLSPLVHRLGQAGRAGPVLLLASRAAPWAGSLAQAIARRRGLDLFSTFDLGCLTVALPPDAPPRLATFLHPQRD